MRLFIAAIALGLSFLAAHAQAIEYRECTVTDQHRFEEGAMSGHWGHHLGHLVRTQNNGLWFADDSGNDVNVTGKVRYYQLTEDSVWVLRAEVDNYGTVQQNTASVAVGDTIFSYGVDISGPAIVEARLNTGTLESASRRVRYIASSTNYIGAVVSPRGERVVWWTEVVYGGSPSKWNYIFHRGDAWSDRLRASVYGYVDFSYVMATFVNDTTLFVAGEALKEIAGTTTTWEYALGVGKVKLGQPMTEFTVLPGANYTSRDIWYDRRNDAVHVLGDGAGGRLTCYWRPVEGAWPDRADSVTVPETIWRGTRFLDGPDGRLYLVLSTPEGLKLKSIAKDSIGGPIPFDSLTTYDIHGNEGFDRVFAVFPERSEYQTAPVAGLNFAYPGNDYDYAHIVKHISLRMSDGEWVPVRGHGERPTGLLLDPAVPNPFNPATSIGFALPESGHVRLEIVNLAGQHVRTLVDGAVSAGRHSVEWDGTDALGRHAAAGVFVCRLSAYGETRSRRLVLAR